MVSPPKIRSYFARVDLILPGKFSCAQSDLRQLWVYDAKIIIHFHEDGFFQAACIEHHLFIFFYQRVCQHRQLFIERKGRDRPDHTPAQLLRFFARRKSGFGATEMFLDRVQIDAAITGHIRQTVTRFLLPETDHHYNGFDRLFDSIPPELLDHFSVTLGLMFHDAIDDLVFIEQGSYFFMDGRNSFSHSESVISLYKPRTRAAQQRTVRDHPDRFVARPVRPYRLYSTMQ